MGVMLKLLLVFALLVPSSLWAMPTSAPVMQQNSTSQLVADTDAIAPGEPFWVALEMVLAPQWHTYWENPGDSGMPTTLKWSLPEGFTAGPVHFPPPHRVELAGLMNFAYEGKVYFPVPITPPKELGNKEYTLTLKANWLVCKDICVPEGGEYTLTLPVGEAGEISHLENALKAIPKPLKAKARYAVSGEQLVLTLPAGELANRRDSHAEFFPYADGVIDNLAEQKTAWSEDTLTLTLKRGAAKENPERKALLALGEGDDRQGYLLTAEYTDALPSAASGGMSLGLALLLAFAGGLVLNLMPCVLPILSLKALALVKKSAASRKESAAHGMAYTAGILASFAAIAILLIALQQAGGAVGWGFQLQSPGFVTVLALITFGVGLNLSGVFTVPHLFGGAGQALAAKHGLPGTFFTGTLAVLVATPCTAPFMAPALGFALTQPPIAAFLVFEALALGFAAPLLLVSLSPKLLSLLPKPGAWMHTFKQLMAFPMYATSAWLVWVLTEQGGERALSEALALLVGAAFLLWLHEHLKTKLVHELYHIGLLVFAVFFVWLLLSSPGELPEVEEVPFSQEKLSNLRAEDKPVFVYATASWCITCKLNEATSLRTATAMEHFKQEGIVVMKADWTNQDKEISDFLRGFDRQGVPLYVFYPKAGKEPRVLPQILTPYLLVEQTAP